MGGYLQRFASTPARTLMLVVAQPTTLVSVVVVGGGFGGVIGGMVVSMFDPNHLLSLL